MKIPTSEEPMAPARRSVLVGGIYALWGAISAVLGAPAVVYLFFPPRTPKPDLWVVAGDVSALAGGRPVELVFRRNRTDGWKITSQKTTAWAVRGPGGQVTAFSPQCTHLGCAYHWDDARSEFVGHGGGHSDRSAGAGGGALRGAVAGRGRAGRHGDVTRGSSGCTCCCCRRRPWLLLGCTCTW